jgi:hypothetical protein
MNGEGEWPEESSENSEIVRLFTSDIQGVFNFSTESINSVLANQGSAEYFGVLFGESVS